MLLASLQLTSSGLNNLTLEKKQHMEHLTSQDLIVCLVAIIAYWFYKFSSEKDIYDDKEDKSGFSSGKWVKDFIWYKWDNIICHIIASFGFLYLGEEKLASLLGEYMDKLPTGADQLGSSAVIGFFGSFIAEALKKLVSIINK